MAKLIDVDKVTEAIAWLNEYDFVLWNEVVKCIDKVPTVEAITKEWIKQWREDKWFSKKPIEERIIMAMGVRLMLEDWEKENEKD